MSAGAKRATYRPPQLTELADKSLVQLQCIRAELQRRYDTAGEDGVRQFIAHVDELIARAKERESKE